jgi:hypothetical protein
MCDLMDLDSQRWNIPLIQEIFHREEAGMICGMAICPFTQQDHTVWVGNKNGYSLLRSAYHLVNEINQRVGGTSTS